MILSGKNKKTAAMLLIVVCLYMLTGLYTLQSGQSAVVLRFGKAVEVTTKSGIHYHLPYPVDRHMKVNISTVQTVHVQDKKGNGVEVITGDENIIQIRMLINYDVKDITGYIYSAADIERIIKSTGETILSRELAAMEVDDVMAKGKSLLHIVMKDKVQEILNELGAGVRVISVELTNISPPKVVSPTFNAVSNAREKKQEIIKDAEGYANSVIPKARGEAMKSVHEAEAYARETVDRATAMSSVYKQMLFSYWSSPVNTRKTMYYESMERILKRCSVGVDSNPSGSYIYINRAPAISEKNDSP